MSDQDNNIYKYLFFGLLFVIVLIGGMIVSYFLGLSKAQEAQENTNASSTSVLEPSLPPDVLPSPENVPAPSPSPQPSSSSESSDEILIKTALAKKHQKTLDDVVLRISDITASHAKGIVSFQGEPSGGWWLAAKQDNNWTIVADGNGTIPCGPVETYKFPAAMVGECYDETAKEVKQR